VIADKIYLVGFMAAGKTTVAHALASRLGWRVEDVDALIEARERRPVSEIFARAGEPYFRAVEREILKVLLPIRHVVIATGGGIRSRHVTSIGMDLGLPTGVLAQLRIIDALGNAHLLGTLLAPHGVVAIPPEILGHMLPFFIKSAPAVICNGDPPFSIWEHPPRVGRIPPHRTDSGSFLLAECYGCANHTLIKDVDGLYEADPKTNPNTGFIKDITVTELKARNLPTLPFDRVLIDLLACARQVKQFQIINGLKPHLLEPALRGEHVGTIVRKDATS